MLWFVHICFATRSVDHKPILLQAWSASSLRMLPAERMEATPRQDQVIVDHYLCISSQLRQQPRRRHMLAAATAIDWRFLECWALTTRLKLICSAVYHTFSSGTGVMKYNVKSEHCVACATFGRGRQPQRRYGVTEGAAVEFKHAQRNSDTGACAGSSWQTGRVCLGLNTSHDTLTEHFHVGSRMLTDGRKTKQGAVEIMLTQVTPFSNNASSASTVHLNSNSP
jgi:hypothetical protein